MRQSNDQASHKFSRRRVLAGAGTLAAGGLLPARLAAQRSETETDILVIGGGIAGSSTAFHLAEQGRDVILLERGEIASEASGQNMGGLGGAGWGNMPNLLSYLTMGSLDIFKELQVEEQVFRALAASVIVFVLFEPPICICDR